MDLELVSYRVAEKTFHGYSAHGSKDRPMPGILVAHDGPGLNEHTKERALMLAELGYVAFAMDIYGAVDPPLEEAKTIVKALRSNPSMLRLRARTALEVLKALSGVDARKIAAIGFCFGGTTVLELARSGADLAGVVGFHAGLAPLAAAERGAIRCPVLICTGANDPIVTAEQRQVFGLEMSSAGVDWQMLLMGGAGHCFTNRWVDAAKIPGFAYDRIADVRSWSAMRSFFDEVFNEKRADARSRSSRSRAEASPDPPRR
jgi:dienelactone hydrolase